MSNALAERGIETEAKAACPACNHKGFVKLRRCADHLCGLPGVWTFSQCAVCGSLWLNPRPIERALPLLYPETYTCTRTVDAQELQTSRSFTARVKDAVLARYFGYDLSTTTNIGHPPRALAAIFGWLFRKKAGYSVRFLKARDHGRLLDIGCGNGGFMQSMSRLGWSVQGIEVDRVAAQRAIERGMTVHLGNVQDIDLPKMHFDAITLTHVTEHLFDPVRAFSAVQRWLKPNGVLVSVSPNPRGVVSRLFGNKWYALDPPRHLFLPSAAAYRRMLEPLGFEVVTWTSMRLVHWDFKQSLSIAVHGKVDAIKDSALLRIATSALSMLLSILPGSGEEVICYARRR
jgi:2-polyprenyl-3-methyl-5-hydroxy-6-metoxy-1,4-benzoquinol methylase